MQASPRAVGLLVLDPKLRLIRYAISGLTWVFTGLAGWRSGYFKVSGIVVPRSWNACRWALVGSVSIGDGDGGAGVPDLVAGQGGQVLEQAAEAVVGLAAGSCW